jgi:hypothetical protein
MSISDWPQQITVTVDAADIAMGEPRSWHFCPVASAAARALDIEHDYIHVDVASIMAYLDDDDHDCDGDRPDAVWDLPQQARDFIFRFDNSQPVAPFTFTTERVT